MRQTIVTVFERPHKFELLAAATSEMQQYAASVLCDFEIDSYQVTKLAKELKNWARAATGDHYKSQRFSTVEASDKKYDNDRDIHSHPGPTTGVSFCSKLDVDYSTILFDGLDPEEYKVSGERPGSIFDVTEFAVLSSGIHTVRQDFAERGVVLIQPGNGAIATFEGPHARPALPDNTSRLFIFEDNMAV